VERINLSTRPFYNERPLHAALGVLAAIVLAVTVFNLWEVYALSRHQADLQARIGLAEGKSREFRDQASRIRGSINPRDLDATIAAAREANVLIERRVFSWTDLFNRFEETLPPNVRITAVRPRIERDGSMTLEMVVVARSVEGVNTFIENLEKSTAFQGVLSREEYVNPDGLIQAKIGRASCRERVY
jgi:Tfp pilus assembly protein PilN